MEKRVLIDRWLKSQTDAIPVYDEASVSTARQRVRAVGETIGVTKRLVETMALVASELTHNQLAHSKQGYFAVSPVERQDVKGLEVIAADLGPGIVRPVLNGSDSVSGGTSLGAGLAGVFRLADEVAIDTRGSEGVCIVARKFERSVPRRSEIAIAGVPYPGEIISGDDGVVVSTENGFVAAVCDGLGHGPEARTASNHAVEVVMRHAGHGLEEIAVAMNAELAGTRGCALGLVRYQPQSRTLQCVLAGDVRAHVYQLRDAHFFTGVPRIVGEADFRKRKLRMEEVAVAPGSVLAMFTDGLETRTSLTGQLETLRQPTIRIAQQMLETHSRRNDDALVLIARLMA